MESKRDVKIEVEDYKRNTVYGNLKGLCFFAEEDDFIEVTEWFNQEGFDFSVISSKHTNSIVSITYGEFELLKNLVEALERLER